MRFIIGVDEAGRGPLAGPVAVAAVIADHALDIAAEFPGVKDSKQISERKREALFALLEGRATRGDLRYAVSFSDADRIDASGIARVIQNAVAEVVHALASEPDTARIMLDGSLKAPPAYPQETIIDGDALVPIISLASIAAKVTRDRLMYDMEEQYPGYGFARHKGYGTKAHYAALARLGPSPIHRRTFLHS